MHDLVSRLLLFAIALVEALALLRFIAFRLAKFYRSLLRITRFVRGEQPQGISDPKRNPRLPESVEPCRYQTVQRYDLQARSASLNLRRRRGKRSQRRHPLNGQGKLFGD